MEQIKPHFFDMSVMKIHAMNDLLSNLDLQEFTVRSHSDQSQPSSQFHCSKENFSFSCKCAGASIAAPVDDPNDINTGTDESDSKRLRPVPIAKMKRHKLQLLANMFKTSADITYDHLSEEIMLDRIVDHDTTAVHLYQIRFIAFLRRFLPARLQPRNIIYFSDGAASQYKNRKNFINLCHHEEDYGISAEWHFSATAHGKGACDGLGGTVKRLAARASLQRPYTEQIMTPHQLYNWTSFSSF